MIPLRYQAEKGNCFKKAHHYDYLDPPPTFGTENAAIAVAFHRSKTEDVSLFLDLTAMPSALCSMPSLGESGGQMNPRGFTLIEVTVGLLVLAIGLLAVCGMQIVSIRGNSFSNNLTQAAILAQDRFEALRSVPFDHPDLGSASHLEKSCSGTIFTREYTVTHNPLYPDSKNITVAVSWSDSSDHRVTFTTVISR